jgi:hypothetical protein
MHEPHDILGADSFGSFTLWPLWRSLKRWLRAEVFVKLERQAKVLLTTNASAVADPKLLVAGALPTIKPRFAFATD